MNRAGSAAHSVMISLRRPSMDFASRSTRVTRARRNNRENARVMRTARSTLVLNSDRTRSKTEPATTMKSNLFHESLQYSLQPMATIWQAPHQQQRPHTHGT